MAHRSTDHGGVAGVLRVDGHGDVAQHRLGSRRRYHQLVVEHGFKNQIFGCSFWNANFTVSIIIEWNDHFSKRCIKFSDNDVRL